MRDTKRCGNCRHFHSSLTCEEFIDVIAEEVVTVRAERDRERERAERLAVRTATLRTALEGLWRGMDLKVSPLSVESDPMINIVEFRVGRHDVLRAWAALRGDERTTASATTTNEGGE